VRVVQPVVRRCLGGVGCFCVSDTAQVELKSETSVSPWLSAHRGFYGCKHFSQANAFIESNGGAPVDWQIEPHNEFVAR